jgi:hypothetical protein
MARRTTAARRRQQEAGRKANWGIAAFALIAGAVVVAVYQTFASHRELDKVTLCPSDPDSLTVLVVDVTDPMNVAQRQDFLNQLDKLRSSVPRYGKLVIAKVDAVSNRPLAPVITRCNPGTANDVTDWTGNKRMTQEKWEQGYKAPLDKAFDQLMNASGAARSPILESIQSVNLTELQDAQFGDKPRRLVVASDLLQNTDRISFYGQLPDPNDFTTSQEFSRVRTNLNGVDVELWMLQRDDSRLTQPRALPDLWDRIINAQDGRLSRLYTVSG